VKREVEDWRNCEKMEKKMEKLCVNAIDCIYCLCVWPKEIAHPSTALVFFPRGKKTSGVSDRCDSAGYFQNTHTHTFTRTAAAAETLWSRDAYLRYVCFL